MFSSVTDAKGIHKNWLIHAAVNNKADFRWKN